MSKSNEGKEVRERVKVDITAKTEVEYVHTQFPHLSYQQIIDAINNHGPYRKEIMDHLRTKLKRDRGTE